METEFEKTTTALISQKLVAKLLEENNFEERLKNHIAEASHSMEDVKLQLRTSVVNGLSDEPENRWDRPIQDIANKLVQTMKVN